MKIISRSYQVNSPEVEVKEPTPDNPLDALYNRLPQLKDKDAFEWLPEHRMQYLKAQCEWLHQMFNDGESASMKMLSHFGHMMHNLKISELELSAQFKGTKDEVEKENVYFKVVRKTSSNNNGKNDTKPFFQEELGEDDNSQSPLKFSNFWDQPEACTELLSQLIDQVKTQNQEVAGDDIMVMLGHIVYVSNWCSYMGEEKKTVQMDGLEKDSIDVNSAKGRELSAQKIDVLIKVEPQKYKLTNVLGQRMKN